MNIKKVNKIYSKIDSIAKKGELGRVEYYQYVAELFRDGLYSAFQDTLLRKYGIDTIDISSVDYVKSKTFGIIRFQTNSKFQEDIKKFNDSVGVVQIGQYIYSSASNIGRILEVENNNVVEVTAFSNYNGSTFSGSATSSLLSKYQSSIYFLINHIPSITTSTTTTTTTIFSSTYSYSIVVSSIDGSGNKYGWPNATSSCSNYNTGSIVTVYSNSSNFINGINLYTDDHGGPLSTYFRQDYPYSYYYYMGSSASFNIAGYIVSDISIC